MILRPSMEDVPELFIPHIDKLAHFFAFAFLGALLIKTFPQLRLSYYSLIIFSYAWLTEILQYQMQWGRTFEYWDILADVLGAFFAIICLYKRSNQ